jgi:hypothetical protein
MLSQDKLTKLFALASGKPVTSKPIEKKKPDTTKIKNRLDFYKSAYSDPVTAWSNWASEAKKNATSETADDIWNHAEMNYPGDPSQAREAIRSNIRSGLSTEPVSKEVDLRNAMQSAPSWMQDELTPEMALTSNTVSAQNSAKAQAMYSMALKKKLSSMNLNELDIDVPAEIHAQEFITLEVLNKLDEAQIVNGRVCLLNEQGAIQPAYSMMDNPEIQNMLSADSPEATMVSSLANKLVIPTIQNALSNSKEMGSMDNRAAGGAALDMLKSGDVPVDNWGSLLGMINGDGLNAGIDGISARNPHMSPEDELMQGIDIYTQYGGVNA